MKSLVLVLVCAGLLGLLLACHVAVGDGDAPQVMVNDEGVWYRADIQVTKDNFGQTVRAGKGSLVDVCLAENTTTGYSWRCTIPSDATVMLVRSASVRPTTGMIGAGGMRHFLLLVTGTGTAAVTLQYGRWWAGGEREQPQSITIETSGPPKLGFE